MVMICYALKAAQDIRNMGSKDSPVGVDLIDNDISQVGKEIIPLGVMRKNSQMQHIRIRNDDIGIFTDIAPVGSRSIAII